MKKNIPTLILALFLICGCQAQQDKIVFASNRSGNYDIYTMNTDGNNLKSLTSHQARDAWPKWSPNGEKIIFCSERFGKNQIMIMNADGSQKINLSNNNNNELDPIISPDGKKIAFTSKVKGNYQLHTMNLDGSNRQQLTNTGPFCGRPDWSPDSKRLVYLSMETGYYEIFRINADGSGKKQLTDMKTEVGSPCWSDHGYYILFHAHENEVDQLFKMNANGSKITKVKSRNLSDYQGRWNGSSSKIVYSSFRDGNSEIYISHLKNEEEIRLTNNDANDSMADWFSPWDRGESVEIDPVLPANYFLTFTSYRSGSAEVYLMRPNGTDLKQLTQSDQNNSFPEDYGDQKHIKYRSSNPANGNDFKEYIINPSNKATSPYQIDQLIDSSLVETLDPSQRYIAYLMMIDDTKELFLLDQKTQQTTQITCNKSDQTPAQQYHHIWSPDGSKLAYMNGPDYYNQFLKIYDLESGKTSTITKRGYMNAGLQWLKNSKQLILNIKIQNKTTYEIWCIDADGKNFIQLTDHPGRGSVHPAVSPDGNWIAFDTGRDGDDGEIYLMRPDGSQQTRITYHPSFDGRVKWVILK